MHQSNTTNFNVLFYYLGQHFSTRIESSQALLRYRLLVRICILEGPEDDFIRVETCCSKQRNNISIISQLIAPYFIIQSLKYYKTHIEL